MKKYRMFFGWVKTALIALVILAGLAIIILDSIMISGGVQSLATANKTVAAVSLAAGAVITAAAVLLLVNSYYSFRDDELNVVFGFFVDRIPYSDVQKIAVNADTKEIFVAYKNDKGELIRIRVNLAPERSADFLAELEKKCAFASVETFIPPSDINKNKES